jgi:hypothetical protein
MPGDGFTKEELSDALHPLNRKWDPGQEYEELGIEDLVPGPKAVTFIGRIVNISTLWSHSQKQPKAAGWHYLILKSNTAAISVYISFVKCHSSRLILYRSNYTSLAKRILCGWAKPFLSGQPSYLMPLSLRLLPSHLPL